MNQKLPKRILIAVAGAHLLLILALGISLPSLFQKKPKPTDYIEMIDLGTPDAGEGSPMAEETPVPPAVQPAPPTPPQQQKPEPPAPTQLPQPTPKPIATPVPQPKPTAIPEPTSKPEPQVKPQPKATPAPTDRPTVKVNLKKTARKSEASSSSTSPQQTSAKVSAQDIKKRLAQSVSSVGISGGTGSGRFGSPQGVSNEVSRYHTLIRDTLQRNWKKPELTGTAQLETFVTIRIFPDGRVQFISTTQPSGNSAMDASVQTAVRSTERIPEPPPAGLAQPYYEVTVNFRLL